MTLSNLKPNDKFKSAARAILVAASYVAMILFILWRWLKPDSLEQLMNGVAVIMIIAGSGVLAWRLAFGRGA